MTTSRCVLASHPVQCGLNVSLICKRETSTGFAPFLMSRTIKACSAGTLCTR